MCNLRKLQGWNPHAVNIMDDSAASPTEDLIVTALDNLSKYYHGTKQEVDNLVSASNLHLSMDNLFGDSNDNLSFLDSSSSDESESEREPRRERQYFDRDEQYFDGYDESSADDESDTDEYRFDPNLMDTDDDLTDLPISDTASNIVFDESFGYGYGSSDDDDETQTTVTATSVNSSSHSNRRNGGEEDRSVSTSSRSRSASSRGNSSVALSTANHGQAQAADSVGTWDTNTISSLASSSLAPPPKKSALKMTMMVNDDSRWGESMSSFGNNSSKATSIGGHDSTNSFGVTSLKNNNNDMEDDLNNSNASNALVKKLKYLDRELVRPTRQPSSSLRGTSSSAVRRNIARNRSSDRKLTLGNVAEDIGNASPLESPSNSRRVLNDTQYPPCSPGGDSLLDDAMPALVPALSPSPRPRNPTRNCLTVSLSQKLKPLKLNDVVKQREAKKKRQQLKINEYLSRNNNRNNDNDIAGGGRQSSTRPTDNDTVCTENNTVCTENNTLCEDSILVSVDTLVQQAMSGGVMKPPEVKVSRRSVLSSPSGSRSSRKSPKKLSNAKKLRSLLEEKINDGDDFLVNNNNGNKISKLFSEPDGTSTNTEEKLNSSTKSPVSVFQF